jgi:hypothetical protein
MTMRAHAAQPLTELHADVLAQLRYRWTDWLSRRAMARAWRNKGRAL